MNSDATRVVLRSTNYICIMKEFGIFYGSTTGTTADVARRIARLLGVDDEDVHNVATAAPSAVAAYKTLVLGSSTWGNGDLQEDWYSFLDGLEVLDLKGKRIAVFGCGDETMSDTFCGAVGTIYRRLQDTGADFIGDYDADGYHYDHTPAMIDGRIVGLLIDEVNHPELTDTRLRGWTDRL